MAQTKLSSLINPQVMADMIAAQLPNKIKFAPIARIDTTLVGQAGDTITIPKYGYIGDAVDLTEGVAMGTVVLTASTQSATIKQVGQGVELTDKSALAGYGDPVGESERQIVESIGAKVDTDVIAALGTATLTHDGSAAAISYNAIVDAVDKFEEEDDEVKILFIHSKQKTTLRKDPNFLASVPNAFMTGTVGEIAGCQVVVSNKVPVNAGVYTNFIVKAGAVALYMKRDVEVETDRDILAKTTVITADSYYVAALEDDSKVVKLTAQ